MHTCKGNKFYTTISMFTIIKKKKLFHEINPPRPNVYQIQIPQATHIVKHTNVVTRSAWP